MKTFSLMSGFAALLIGNGAIGIPGVHIQKHASKNLNNEILLEKETKFGADFVKEIRKYLSYISNPLLTNDLIIKLMEDKLKGILEGKEEFLSILDLLKPNSMVRLVIGQLALDWAKEASWGTNPMEAMKSYIHQTLDGQKAQARNVGSADEWYYVAKRAANWSWQEFYEYMAGVQANYMFKQLTNGKYLGEIISDCLHLGGNGNWGFDNNKFMETITKAMTALNNNAWAKEALSKAIIPILKVRLLAMTDATQGKRYLTWDKTDNFEQLSLKMIIAQLEYLFTTPKGQQQLKGILAEVIQSAFTEDIIVDMGMLGYYTLPGLLQLANSWPFSAIIGAGVNPTNIAATLTKPLVEFYQQSGVSAIFQEIKTVFENIDSHKVNFQVAFTIFAKRLDAVNDWQPLDIALDKLKAFLQNSPSNESLKEIIILLGGNPGKKTFVKGSPLAQLEKSIAEPNSMFNQVLNVFEEYLS